MAERVDVAIVGGGLAGLTTAVALSEAGVGVRLFDHGEFRGRPGGGLVPSYTLAPLGGPSVRQEVPYDRDVLDRRWLFLSAEGDVTLDFRDAPFVLPTDGLHTVRTSTLSPWLAGRARTLGADLRPRTQVDALRRDGRGRVQGVVAGGAETEALVTVLADAGGLAATTARPLPPTVAVAESFWAMSEQTVTERFGARPGYGTITELFLGELSPEAPAGGYVLPFREGVSVGVVAPLPASGPARDLALLDRLERHPSVAPWLRGASRADPVRIEISDNPEVGRPLSGAGFLTVGTSAGLVAAGGARLRGIDAAIRSGQIAAEVARDAVASKDASALRLGTYRLHLVAHGLLDELRRVRRSGRRYREAPGVAQGIPRLLNAAAHELMTETGGPKSRVVPTIRRVRRRSKVSRRTLLRAALVAGRWA